MKTVPILITWDIDPLTKEECMREGLDFRKGEEAILKKSINSAVEIIETLKIRTTFFVTSKLGNMLRAELDEIMKTGNQVGCHGLTHDNREDFSRMTEARQDRVLREATENLEKLLGRKVNVFRAPRVKVSAHTLRILDMLGYQADSSISSQRLDFLSSSWTYPKPLFAPRLPYHPSPDNPFVEGDLKIWEIPVSAAGLPFISGTLSILGLGVMKRLARKLHQESLKTGKPMVYLIHPAEFLASSREMSGELFAPSKDWFVNGLPVRYLMFRKDGNVLFKENRALFEYLMGLKNAKFMTVGDYVKLLESEVGEKR